MIDKITVYAGLAYGKEDSKKILSNNYIIDDTFLLSLIVKGYDTDTRDIMEFLTWVYERYNTADFHIGVDMKIIEENVLSDFILATVKVAVTIRSKR